MRDDNNTVGDQSKFFIFQNAFDYTVYAMWVDTNTVVVQAKFTTSLKHFWFYMQCWMRVPVHHPHTHVLRTNRLKLRL